MSFEGEMDKDDKDQLRNDRDLLDAKWDRILSAAEVRMIREYRETGRSGCALIHGGGYLTQENTERLVAAVREGLGVHKVLILPDGVSVSLI